MHTCVSSAASCRPMRTSGFACALRQRRASSRLRAGRTRGASSMTSTRRTARRSQPRRLQRIGALYAIERDIRGSAARASVQRCAKRDAAPLLDQLHAWLSATLRTVSAKSQLAAAIHYALVRWTQLTRYLRRWAHRDRQQHRRACDPPAGAGPAQLPVRRLGRRRRARGQHLQPGGHGACSMRWTPTCTCATCSSASPIIRSTASRNCCRGTWPQTCP